CQEQTQNAGLLRRDYLFPIWTRAMLRKRLAKLQVGATGPHILVPPPAVEQTQQTVLLACPKQPVVAHLEHRLAIVLDVSDAHPAGVDRIEFGDLAPAAIDPLVQKGWAASGSAGESVLDREEQLVRAVPIDIDMHVRGRLVPKHVEDLGHVCNGARQDIAILEEDIGPTHARKKVRCREQRLDCSPLLVGVVRAVILDQLAGPGTLRSSCSKLYRDDRGQHRAAYRDGPRSKE